MKKRSWSKTDAERQTQRDRDRQMQTKIMKREKKIDDRKERKKVKKNRKMNKYKQIKSEIGDVNECTTDRDDNN